MATTRVLWDEYETAILMDFFMQYKTGKITKTDAIGSASKTLRERAKKNGIEIDDVFRNENGIAMQMSKIADLYARRKGRLSKAPLVFENIVDKYVNDRPSFDRILKEARGVNDGIISVQEQFFKWLSNKASPAQMSELYFTYSEIESFCIERKILKQPLFETTSVKSIASVKAVIDSNKVFRFTHKKQIGKMQAAIQYYYSFVKEYQSALQNYEQEAQPISKPIEVDTLVPAAINSHPQNMDKSVVLFNAQESYAFTRPEKLLYFGEEYAVKNWTQVYVQTVRCLYGDYPEEITKLNGTNIGQHGRIDIADASLVRNMAAPKEFMDGYYLETNLSATDIASKIKYLLDLCGVDYENVVITYFFTKAETPNKNGVVLSTGTLIDYLKENDVYYVDNRGKGGCLWIRDAKEIQKVVDYCKKNFKVTFHYREEGSRSLNGEMGWWTNDVEDKIAKPVTSSLIGSTRTPASSDSKAFLHWMVDEQHMATSSGRSYASGINNCEQMARQLGLEHTKLYGVEYEDARRTADALMQTVDFKEANDSQHNRLRASLSKYLQFLSGDRGLALSQAAPVIASQPKSIEDLSPYDKVLQENFSKGYRVESTLDLKRFIRYYNAIYGTDLDVNDEEVRGKTKQNIISAGIRHGDYVFSAESVVSSETKEHLISYVERSFSQGKRVIYYKALFEEFNEEFLGQHIYDEDMLRTYLVHVCGSDYVFERSFMSQERNVQIDPKEEIREILIAHGAPMKTEELYIKLSHFPSDRIDWAIHTNKEFVCNTWGEYFHISLIDLSDDELEDIAAIIRQTIEESHFVSGNELIHAIRRKYPSMLERFPQFSQLGLRDSIAYFLGDRFSFNGNIISPLHKQLSMSDVFAEFARTHHSFTIDELNVLKNEMNSTIYFDSIYANSLRVSQHQFVSKEAADFDVANTDKAISAFCAGDYISLAEVTSFGSFPYAAFPWNIYLLEHYVAAYSNEYKLLHTSFNADNCVGAIVKKSSGIENFNELITDVLAHSGVDLNKKDALQYLCEMGYLARRRFSDIDQILIKARAKKG